MDANKIHAVSKICEEITKAVTPLGFKPEFSGLQDGKASKDFSMKVSFGDRPAAESGQLDLNVP